MGLLTQSREPDYDRARADSARTNRLEGPANEAYLDLVARRTFRALPRRIPDVSDGRSFVNCALRLCSCLPVTVR